MNIQGKVWGHTIPLFNKNNVELHTLFINKGGFCSKHRHTAKFNRFFVLKGKLKITIWKAYADTFLEDVTYLSAGQECTVSPGDFHQFEAIENTEALEIYWVELRESDIERENTGGIK